MKKTSFLCSEEKRCMSVCTMESGSDQQETSESGEFSDKFLLSSSPPTWDSKTCFPNREEVVTSRDYTSSIPNFTDSRKSILLALPRRVS